MMGKRKFDIPEKEITAFCKKWDIKDFSLFGSVLTDNFTPDSDIDVLVTFGDNSHHTLFDLVRMERELRQIFGCDVDIVSRRGLSFSRNYIRRDAILNSAETVYASR